MRIFLFIINAVHHIINFKAIFVFKFIFYLDLKKIDIDFLYYYSIIGYKI